MTCPFTITVTVQPQGLLGALAGEQSMTLGCRFGGPHKICEPLLPPGVRITGAKRTWRIKL